jgi:DNA mismatch endonuclease (patch repair protein)
MMGLLPWPPLVRDVATSLRLSKIRQKDTTPERLVRTLLSGLGLRFRVGNRDLPGSPDIANRSARWAVFVHGCFWHSHRGCKAATVPKRNRAFWVAKFAANVERDAVAVAALRRRGFRVVVVWECEIEKRPLVVVARLRRSLAYTRGKRAS